MRHQPVVLAGSALHAGFIVCLRVPWVFLDSGARHRAITASLPACPSIYPSDRTMVKNYWYLNMLEDQFESLRARHFVQNWARQQPPILPSQRRQVSVAVRFSCRGTDFARIDDLAADAKSFTIAAHQLGVSSPAIGKAVPSGGALRAFHRSAEPTCRRSFERRSGILDIGRHQKGRSSEEPLHGVERRSRSGKVLAPTRLKMFATHRPNHN